jgi:hypothetical protein
LPKGVFPQNTEEMHQPSPFGLIEIRALLLAVKSILFELFTIEPSRAKVMPVTCIHIKAVYALACQTWTADLRSVR